MSTTVGTELIKPHGGQLIERSGPRPEGVGGRRCLQSRAKARTEQKRHGPPKKKAVLSGENDRTAERLRRG